MSYYDCNNILHSWLLVKVEKYPPCSLNCHDPNPPYMKNLNLFKSYGRKLAHFKLKHGRNKCPQFCTVNSPPVGTKFRVPLAQLKEHPQQLFLALRQLFLAQLREIFFGTTVPKGSKKNSFTAESTAFHALWSENRATWQKTTDSPTSPRRLAALP